MWRREARDEGRCGGAVPNNAYQTKREEELVGDITATNGMITS